jgi:hypothetical protein
MQRGVCPSTHSRSNRQPTLEGSGGTPAPAGGTPTLPKTDAASDQRFLPWVADRRLTRNRFLTPSAPRDTATRQRKDEDERSAPAQVPMTETTTVRRWGAPRCSKRKMPCQVPRARRPWATGMLSLEELVEIRARRGIGVLVDDETGAGVLEEHGGQSGGDAAFAEDPGDLRGDLVSAFAASLDRERGGERFHEDGPETAPGTVCQSPLPWPPIAA